MNATAVLLAPRRRARPARGLRTAVRPLARSLTYTRLLHLLIVNALPALLIFVAGGFAPAMAATALCLLVAGAVPGMRVVEGVQARLLFPRGEGAGHVGERPSAGWGERLRLMVWLEVRLVLGSGVTMLCVWLPTLAEISWGGEVPPGLGFLPQTRDWWAWLSPLPLLALYGAVLGAGAVMARLAVPLLGPSPAERLAALEARTEELLERTRLARELHDSIGHALTVAVLQAGAARAAGDAAFTQRALGAIEETGRAALEDLERVLGVLREPGSAARGRPGLDRAERLFASARAAGAEVTVRVDGALDALPGPVSREAYRMTQEALTNALRHAGPVPVEVVFTVDTRALTLDFTNPLPPDARPFPGGGTGLRGLRERAAVLGGSATAGARDGRWRLRVRLPLEALRETGK
ncbi:sensor histidine kinase [Streptomyces sp. NPDC088923]|uniref:sensor histidine kinase n=1 Tax=Streptomyces sp. NPDC088923 TaxID=3365913 RepID=UPI003802B800